jgi:hypothetical protein
VRALAILEGNGDDGIYVDSGTVTVGDIGAASAEAGPVTIQTNNSSEVFLRTDSVAIFNNTGNRIISNTGWGVLCTGAPSNPLIY